MTTNQLKYWELRWKQWYEFQLLKHKQAELAEQKRATRVKEKQEYERITIDRGDLDRKWAELDEKKRAAIVGEALRKYEADIQFMNVASMAEQRLQQMKTVAADLYLQYTKAEDESQRKWYEAYAEAANKGWGQGAFYAAYEMADKSNLVTQGKNDMLDVFNSIPGFKLPSSTKQSVVPSGGKIVGEVANNNGILAVSKTGPSATKFTKEMKNDFDKFRSDLAQQQHPYAAKVEAAKQNAKQNAGVNYKTGISKLSQPVSRDSYQFSPQTETTRVSSPGGTITSKGIGGSVHSNGSKSSGGSGVIITTNIHKGPGY